MVSVSVFRTVTSVRPCKEHLPSVDAEDVCSLLLLANLLKPHSIQRILFAINILMHMVFN